MDPHQSFAGTGSRRLRDFDAEEVLGLFELEGFHGQTTIWEKKSVPLKNEFNFDWPTTLVLHSLRKEHSQAAPHNNCIA
jgi:hypothetical protein